MTIPTIVASLALLMAALSAGDRVNAMSFHFRMLPPHPENPSDSIIWHSASTLFVRRKGNERPEAARRPNLQGPLTLGPRPMEARAEFKCQSETELLNQNEDVTVAREAVGECAVPEERTDSNHATMVIDYSTCNATQQLEGACEAAGGRFESDFEFSIDCRRHRAGLATVVGTNYSQCVGVSCPKTGEEELYDEVEDIFEYQLINYDVVASCDPSSPASAVSLGGATLVGGFFLLLESIFV